MHPQGTAVKAKLEDWSAPDGPPGLLDASSVIKPYATILSVQSIQPLGPSLLSLMRQLHRSHISPADNQSYKPGALESNCDYPRAR
jgi:hypothetical protein